MVIYVALIAILNLGLGYVLAIYLGAGRPKLTATIGDSPAVLDHTGSDVAE
jgi:hypothetical protein